MGPNNINPFFRDQFKIFRNAIKYGDQVFIRDPETFKLFWVETNKVRRVIVNESEGKLPEQYIVQDINPNLENLTVAAKTVSDFQSGQPNSGYTAPQTYTIPDSAGGGQTGRFNMGPKESAVDAQHVMHISLTEGLDYNWPFGQSILEQIFKVYKQKELLTKGIPVLRIQNLNGGNNWYYSDLELPDNKYCEEDDLLFAWYATFGPYNYSGQKAIYHYHISKVLPINELKDKKLDYYTLLNNTKRLKEKEGKKERKEREKRREVRVREREKKKRRQEREKKGRKRKKRNRTEREK